MWREVAGVGILAEQGSLSQMASNIVKPRPLLRICVSACLAILFAAALAMKPQAAEPKKQPAPKEAPAATSPEDKNEIEKPVASKAAAADVATRRGPASSASASHSPAIADAISCTVIQRVVDRLLRTSPQHDNRLPTLVLELSPQRSKSESGEGTDFTCASSRSPTF